MRKRAARVWAWALALALCLALLCPLSALGAEAQVEVGAEAYVVMDAATGQVVAEKNAHMVNYPASITKIMTLALVLENVDLAKDSGTLVTVSDTAVDALIPRASQVALVKGEQVPLLDLLYATMIESANDASHALAEFVAGSMEDFAVLMNDKAAALGLSGSRFVNPSGQPDDSHVTTAYDMAAITRWALGVPGFRQFFSAVEYTMAPTGLQPAGRQFNSANLLLMPFTRYHCDGATGSKTGYTDNALYTMVTTARRGDTELICVVLKCGTNNLKYDDTNALLDYAFGNFRRVSYAAADLALGTLPVYGGGTEALGELPLQGTADASFLLHNSLGPEAVQVTLDAPDRYVMGESFAPVAVLGLPEQWSAQSGTLATMPLVLAGLDELLATSTGGARPAGQQGEPVSPWVWLAIGIPLLLVCAFAGRVLYVRHRRQKRRMARLAAARAYKPVRLADRPKPPQRTPEKGKRVYTPAAAARQQQPGLRVASRQVYTIQPRRAGERAR